MSCTTGLSCPQTFGNFGRNVRLSTCRTSWDPLRESGEEIESSVEESDCNLEPTVGIHKHTLSNNARDRQRTFV